MKNSTCVLAVVLCALAGCGGKTTAPVATKPVAPLVTVKAPAPPKPEGGPQAPALSAKALHAFRNTQ